MVTGLGGYTLLKESGKEGVKRHSKRYLGTILIFSGLTFVSSGIPFLTNTINIFRYFKA
jgi:hypothetical protein